MLFSLFAITAVFGLLFVGWGFIAGDIGADTDTDGGDGGLWALFSIRTLAFAALAFGGTGMLLRMGGFSALTSIALAAALGVGVWLAVGALFAYLKRSQSGDLLSDSSWIGSEAVLVVPFGKDGIGRITLNAGGQITELWARRAPAYSTHGSESFRRCQIEEIIEGTAIVTPLMASLTD